MVTRTGTTYNSELRIWSGPTSNYDSSVGLGTYIFNYLKSEVAKNPEKVIQVRKSFFFFVNLIPDEFYLEQLNSIVLRNIMITKVEN